MRSLILKQVEEYRKSEQGFPSTVMRWDDFFFIAGIGIVRFTSIRAAKKSNTGAIHLSDTTNDDFRTLDDEQLLQSLTILMRQCSKQL